MANTPRATKIEAAFRVQNEYASPSHLGKIPAGNSPGLKNDTERKSVG